MLPVLSFYQVSCFIFPFKSSYDQHLNAAGNFLRDVQITIGRYILSGRHHAIMSAISLTCIRYKFCWASVVSHLNLSTGGKGCL